MLLLSSTGTHVLDQSSAIITYSSSSTAVSPWPTPGEGSEEALPGPDMCTARIKIAVVQHMRVTVSQAD